MPRLKFTPPMIRTDENNIFARRSIQERLPATIRKTRDLNPDYSDAIRADLNSLAISMESDDTIPALKLPTPDADVWSPAWITHQSHTWLHTDWWFAETYAYRLIIEAVRWWETGRDPFRPIKAEELDGVMLWTILDQALNVEGTDEQRLQALLHMDLWGNRIDLSYEPSLAQGLTVHDDHLLVDDSAAVVTQLMTGSGPVHLIADNFGSELAVDLALIDTLLATVTESVILHLKLHPTFVSDALPADVRWLIGAMITRERNAAVHALGSRLQAALDDGRLRLAPDFYWNSSRLLWDLPRRLSQAFTGAKLVIIKGDANYRRMAGDAVWPVAIPFTEGINYFPAPLVALRTIKADSLLGVSANTVYRLDANEPNWRVSGKYGLIQAAL